MTDPFSPDDIFVNRHLGPSPDERDRMLTALGVPSLETLVDQTVPHSIRMKGELDLPAAMTERELIDHLRKVSDENQVNRSYLGLGYHGCVTPPVILRNIFENPGFYTQYTPYQAEISQGRLEALLNFQTLITELTGLAVANSSLLDEATAAAEAMTLCRRVHDRDPSRNTFLVADHCHPQVIDVVRGRAEPMGYEVIVDDINNFSFDSSVFGCLMQYPTSDGAILDLSETCDLARECGALSVVSSDLLSLTLLKPPGEFGADVAVGNTQRFGIPMFYGGPHAAFIATREEFQRKLPGRIVGVSRDQNGNRALRLALQTREQHIRRDRATSNICTAQVLLAIGASMFAVYHGPDGLKRIATRIQTQARLLANALATAGHAVLHDTIFDTIRFTPKTPNSAEIIAAAENSGINLRLFEDGDIGITLDQTVGEKDLIDLVRVTTGNRSMDFRAAALDLPQSGDDSFTRQSQYLLQSVFNRYHTEHELLRYMRRLESKDLSLTTSMISLGSCTMKLNATAEMIPITFRGFRNIHPFAPPSQVEGYIELIQQLEAWLCQITGFAACSMQPNAGSQGEYAGLLTIRAWQRARGEMQRNVCLIPVSAHGTNPASAVMAGMKVIPIACDDNGNIDVEDVRAKAEHHSDELSAIMITYPSTHGVFEESISDICSIIHEHGGQVYLDGANMNAMVGICRPGDFGGDVCHLNLHKTFCIPHGGGGPGMGPICVAAHLEPYLPGHPMAGSTDDQSVLPVAAAPYGSPGVLPISYAYIAMMGPDGLTTATQTAILNANYVAERLAPHFPVLYRGAQGRIAHECILDLRGIAQETGIDVEDVAKRLMDYGFHAPTVSFPVAGTMMIEPTESESLSEIDRFCDALISIRQEIQEIQEGKVAAENSALRGAPHTYLSVCADTWDRSYSREAAAFPSDWSRENKFWPSVGRIDNVFGDRNLCCTWSPESTDNFS